MFIYFLLIDIMYVNVYIYRVNLLAKRYKSPTVKTPSTTHCLTTIEFAWYTCQSNEHDDLLLRCIFVLQLNFRRNKACYKKMSCTFPDWIFFFVFFTLSSINIYGTAAIITNSYRPLYFPARTGYAIMLTVHVRLGIHYMLRFIALYLSGSGLSNQQKTIPW